MRIVRLIVIMLIGFSTLFIASCKEKTVNPESLNGVQIRIKNSSDAHFYKVLAVFPHDSVGYGHILRGLSSDYVQVSLAYSYAYVELFARDRKYVIQPIDYVGAVPLEEGFYTYTLDIVGDGLYDITISNSRDW